MIEAGGKGGKSPEHSQVCSTCNTVFSVASPYTFSLNISAKRYLGEGESAEDPIWLAQCHTDAKSFVGDQNRR